MATKPDEAALAARKAHLEFVHFALGHAESEPIARRVRLYRAGAQLLEEEQGRKLIERADALEAADKRCREFTLGLDGQSNHH